MRPTWQRVLVHAALLAHGTAARPYRVSVHELTQRHKARNLLNAGPAAPDISSVRISCAPI